MKSMNGIHLGLFLVFGCLLLFLIAQLYYFFWWRKRTISSSSSKETEKEFYNSPLNNLHEPQARQNANFNKEFLQNQFVEEESIETELMRLHQISGPPRFLYTIKEETKEDLESEARKSRSLIDLFQTTTTPLASPKNQHSFNHFLEAKTSEAEFNRLMASPPPTFQFLKDAEEKFHRRMDVVLEKAQKGGHKNDDSVRVSDGDCQDRKAINAPDFYMENGSSVTINVVGKNKERENGKHYNVVQCSSGSSQVLPLASSPPKSTFAIQ